MVNCARPANRQRVKLDPFLVQLLGLVGGGLAVDRATIALPVVHLAGFLGEFAADIIGVAGEMLAQFLELLAKLALMRRHHCNGGRGRLCWCCSGSIASHWRGRSHITFSRAREARRHDRLADLARSANRAGHESALDLPFVGRGARKPALECVAALAGQCIPNHAGPRTTCRWAGAAEGPTTSNRRPCSREGTFARAAVTRAGSMVARTTPGSAAASAIIRPQGSTMSEWPKVSRPFSCLPPCAAAKTKQPFSIARARLRTCQCASPVCLVNAEGMAINELPASASAR